MGSSVMRPRYFFLSGSDAARMSGAWARPLAAVRPVYVFTLTSKSVSKARASVVERLGDEDLVKNAETRSAALLSGKALGYA